MKRKLKVYGNQNRDFTGDPFILLKGKWLKELGFSIGNYIEIDCEKNEIIIKKR